MLPGLHVIGFFEPDNFFYASAASHNIINGLDRLSGWPTSNLYFESVLLLDLATIFTPILSISLSMKLVVVLFYILGVVITYLIAFDLSGKNKRIALLAAFLFAIIPIAVFKTSPYEFRGESFVPILLAASLYLFVKITTSKRTSAYLIFASAIAWVGAFFLWTGGTYILPVGLLFIVGILLIGKGKLDILKTSIIMAITAVALAIAGAYLNIGGLWKQTLIGTITEETQHLTLLSFLSNTSFLSVMVPFGVLFVLWQFKGWEKANCPPSKQQAYLYLAMLATLLITLPIAIEQVRFLVLLAIPFCVFGAIGINAMLNVKIIPSAKYIAVLMLILMFLLSAVQYATVQQANGINRNFMNALAWMKNNTAPNARVLTNWDDGSLVEAVANRTSYTDSVAGENATRMGDFSKFLYAKAGNFSYLDNVSPNYLLVRAYWFQIVYSIRIEGNIPNISTNGTNFQLLEKGNKIINGTNNITLSKVYENNDSIIYKLESR